MAHLSSRTRFALVISACLSMRAVASGDPPRTDYSPGDKVPLDESDLREITLQVLETHPLLSSSPGIKVADAYRANWSSDHAFVVFYPHVDSGGIKQAYQAHCQRQIPNELWDCGMVQIRRYLQLETQDFEVRVRGDLKYEEVLAVIQATRATVQASATDSSTIPDTAIMVYQAGDRCLVNWGNRGGMGQLTVEAYLGKGGDPAKPGDWQTSIFQPEDQ